MDAIPRIKVPSVATHNRCPSQDPIGDTRNISDCDDDKYSLDMSATLKSYRIRVAKEAIGNRKLVAQNEPLFGFIPIYGLKSSIHDTSGNDVCSKILQLHNELRKDGRYNYRGLQIPIPSKLNLPKWGDYSKEYWDWELPLLVKYGFPLIAKLPLCQRNHS